MTSLQSIISPRPLLRKSSLFFSRCSCAHPVLPSFPTRRSSDLHRCRYRDVYWSCWSTWNRSHCSCRWKLPGCAGDRKSTRLNSSHVSISYAVFCLKKKHKYTHDQATSVAADSFSGGTTHLQTLP